MTSKMIVSGSYIDSIFHKKIETDNVSGCEKAQPSGLKYHSFWLQSIVQKHYVTTSPLRLKCMHIENCLVFLEQNMSQ